MMIITHRPRALLALLAAAVMAAGLLALVGAKPAWAEDPSFAPAPNSPFQVGSTPTTVTSADFNGDGTMDLAAQNAGSNTVSVLLGKAGGSFETKQDFAVGSGPTSVISADFDSDGIADLAVTNQNSGSVSVLLGQDLNSDGKGDGTFKAKLDFPVGGPSPTSVINADFNTDGITDLAVATLRTSQESDAGKSDQVSVLLGEDLNGDGKGDVGQDTDGDGMLDGFSTAQRFSIDDNCTGGDPNLCYLVTMSVPNQVITADFNGDNKADLATANAGQGCFVGCTPGGVSVLLGNGNGTFQSPKKVIKDTSFAIWSVAAARLDAGTTVDLVATKTITNSGNSTPNVVLAKKGNGDGTFQAAQEFAVGITPSAVTSADLDGDAKADDLAVSNYGSHNVSVLFNNDSGGFQAARNFPAGDGPAFVIGAGLNADSLADLAVANQDSNNVSVLLNTPATSAPTATNDSFSTNQDTTLDQPAPGVLANDRDPDGDRLTAVQVTGPANGQLTLSADGSFTYTPNAGFSGSDSFTYKATDGSADSNTATVHITVNAPNDAPTCENVAIETDEDSQGSVAANCSDGDPLTYAIEGGPDHGTATVDGSTLKYNPDPNFNGSDSFTYSASDGTANSAAATVDVKVNALNDAPVADDQSVSTDEDVATGVTLGASDVENDDLTYHIVSGPTHGTLSGSGGNLTYTPDDDYVGDDSFTFKANDGTNDSNTATVTITVNDTTAPTVFSVDPSGQPGVSVSPTTNVTITFSEKMDESTLNDVTVKLVKPGRKTTSIPVAMTKTTDGNGRTVLTLNPFGSTKQKLAGTTTYQVTIEGAGDTDDLVVKDSVGNELANDYVSSFTTTRK